jgi:hypothetical protein
LILQLIEYIVKVPIYRDNFSDGRGVGFKKVVSGNLNYEIQRIFDAVSADFFATKAGRHKEF